MKLSYLLKDCVPLWERMLPTDLPDAAYDPEISSIHANSENVVPGGLFIAVKGFKADGHHYIRQAFEKGAVAVISEKEIHENPKVIRVKDTRRAMSLIATRFYGNPSEKICLVGITGTNGKTTTSWILESILNESGVSPGVIGTVNMRYGGKTYDISVTTPDSIELHKSLHEMRNAGVTHVIMEVSSHGIDLDRVSDCSFDIGVFTNLTQDHLDYHKTMSRYFACKKRFFTKILSKGIKASTASAVINMDSEYGKKIAQNVKVKLVGTSCIKKTDADVMACDVKEDINGMHGTIYIAGKSFSFKSGLTGHFNLENILSAAGSAYGLGIDPEIIIKGIEQCRFVPGRLERIENSVKRFIFVDYAHTPDALENILKTLRKIAPARLICVFGCGGDRDKSKRPMMGRIAVQYSDFLVVTSDNPRSEEPMSIIGDILCGIIKDERGSERDSLFQESGHMIDRELCRGRALQHESRPGYQDRLLFFAGYEDLKNGFENRGFFVEPDRKKAIEAALMVSRENDIVVVAGKGHETYQILKDKTIDFDDGNIIKEALACYIQPS